MRTTFPLCLVGLSAVACAPATSTSTAAAFERQDLERLLQGAPVVEVPDLAIVDRCPLEQTDPPAPGRQWVAEVCVWEATVGDPGNSTFATGDTYRGLTPCRDGLVEFSSFCGVSSSPPLAATCSEPFVAICQPKHVALSRDEAIALVRDTAAPPVPVTPIDFFYELEPADEGSCEDEEEGCP